MTGRKRVFIRCSVTAAPVSGMMPVYLSVSVPIETLWVVFVTGTVPSLRSCEHGVWGFSSFSARKECIVVLDLQWSRIDTVLWPVSRDSDRHRLKLA